MNEPVRILHGLVLAGGRSVRMGADKSVLRHPDGRPLARRGADLLAEAGCSRVLVSLRHDQEIPDGIPSRGEIGLVRDPAGGSNGPLSGILAAMELHPDADWLVAACDLPRLDAATLAHLLAARRGGEVFLSYRSEFDGLPEPLCAYYSRESRPLLAQAVAGGLRCPRKVLIRHQCRLLDPPVPGALDNANTPADWLAATSP